MGTFSRRHFTIDAVVHAVHRGLLNPAFIIPLALALRLKPQVFQEPALENSGWLAVAVGLQWSINLLAVLSGLLALQAYLDKQSANNWVCDRTWNWDEEVVIVTGGSNGIGAAIIQELLARNPRTRVANVDFQPLRWKAPAGAQLWHFPCDLSDPTAIRRVCSQIRCQVGAPTVLFNNAGLARGFTLLDAKASDVEVTVRTNLLAPFLMAKEVLPDMVRRDHGHIINTGSLSSLFVPVTLVDYGATKAGLAVLHEGLRLELKMRHRAPRVRLTLGVFYYVRTSLISGTFRQPNFFLPTSDPQSVGKRMVDAAYGGYGQTIYIPFIARLATWLQILPYWVYRQMHERLMEVELDFKGMQEVDEKTGMLRGSSSRGNASSAEMTSGVIAGQWEAGENK